MRKEIDRVKNWKQFLNKNEFIKPIICDLDINKIEDSMKKNGFGLLQDHIEYGGIDLKLSKSLCLNNEIIGGYLLSRGSMLESIKGAIKMNKNGEYKKLNFFVTSDILNKYKGKRGIFGDYLYIDEKFNGNNYAKYLIDYSKSIGDYVWGGSIPNKSFEYWNNIEKRIKIFEYLDEDNIHTIITATQL